MSRKRIIVVDLEKNVKGRPMQNYP